MPSLPQAKGGFALLVCIPVDEEEFRSDWETGRQYIRLEAPSTVDEAWSLRAESTSLIRGLLEEARTLGAIVVRRATLHDLRQACLSSQVVTVVAHLDFPCLTEADILQPIRLERLLTQAEGLEWDLLRQGLDEPPTSKAGVDSANRLFAMSKRLQNASPPTTESDCQRLDRWLLAGYDLVRFDRPTFDDMCGPDIVRPGRGIEMADGMVSAHEFRDCIPDDWNGLLDLRLCASLALGAAIRRRKRHPMIAVSRLPLFATKALFLYNSALEYSLSVRQPDVRYTYLSAMESLIAEVGK